MTELIKIKWPLYEARKLETKRIKFCRIWGFHSGGYEDDTLRIKLWLENLKGSVFVTALSCVGRCLAMGRSYVKGIVPRIPSSEI
jgi:hypothetical protein